MTTEPLFDFGTVVRFTDRSTAAAFGSHIPAGTCGTYEGPTVGGLHQVRVTSQQGTTQLVRVNAAEIECHPWASVAREFGDYDLATLPAIPSHWEDGSWHNDACPFFFITDSLGVFVDYADPAASDFPESRADGSMKRFQLVRLSERQHLIEGDPFVADSDDWDDILAAAIADQFVSNLRRILSEEEFAEMRRRNVQHVDSSICASHDFCDANMPMADAFETITGREPLGSADASEEQNDADCALWNQAWEIAKPQLTEEA